MTREINPDADLVERLRGEPLSVHLAEQAAMEIERLRLVLRGLLDCPDIADNDYKDEETHAAERAARKALEGLK